MAYDENYVRAILENYNDLTAEASRGSIRITTILTDFKLALDDCKCLTPRQRQVLALYYFADLTLEQVGKILNLSHVVTQDYIDAAIKRLSDKLNRDVLGRKGRSVPLLETTRPLFVWVNRVGNGDLPVYTVPQQVTQDIKKWIKEVE